MLTRLRLGMSGSGMRSLLGGSLRRQINMAIGFFTSEGGSGSLYTFGGEETGQLTTHFKVTKESGQLGLIDHP